MEKLPDVIKATFKAKHKNQLDFILHTLRKALGKQNINALSPTYIYRAKIFVLDMDIKIPDTLLRYGSSNEPTEEER